jgi:predicted nucleotidyltransferase
MLQKCSILNVAGVFFKEPTKEHYLMEISKKASIAHTSVKKHLLILEKLSVIQKSVERKGKRKFPLYKANINNKTYRHYKRIYNLFQLEESKLTDFLKDNLMPKSIVLFGSYQKGEDLEDSDIDLFIECKEKKIELSHFKKLLNRDIQIHFKEDFAKYPHELRNNIINGIVLEGYLEAF